MPTNWFDKLFDTVTGGISAIATDRQSERDQELMMAQLTAQSAQANRLLDAPAGTARMGTSNISLFALAALILILLVGRK